MFALFYIRITDFFTKIVAKRLIYIRNIFENVINQQANRLVSENDFTDEKLAELTLADIKSCMEV